MAHIQPQMKDAIMPQRIKTDQENRATPNMLIDVMRESARKLFAQTTLEAEVAELLATYTDQQDDQGRALVVRNGHHWHGAWQL